MAFDTITAIKMTKALSSLLATATDAEITDVLLEHAVPRIRFHMLNATNNAGQNIFYTALSDLSDSTISTNAEQILDSVMDEPTVANALRRIAAAYTCAWLLVSKYSPVASQPAAAHRLEDQANADLDRFCKGELMKTALASAVKTVLSTQTTAILYIGTDIDTNTLDTTNRTGDDFAGAQLPYAGAPDAGKVSGNINGVAFEATIAAGDLPVDVARKLCAAFDALPSSTKPNVTLVPDEVIRANDNRNVTYADPLTGIPATSLFTYTRSMAKITAVPHNYDNVLDVAAITFTLLKRIETAPTTYETSIDGLLYGTDTSVIKLTSKGPHSVVVELKTGKTTSLTQASATSTTPLSDSLFFLTGAPTAFDGTITYRVNGGNVESVEIPTGATAETICELLAQDIASKSADLRILGAVRPSSLLTINGTPTSAPSIEFVGFGIENQLAKLVFHILSVPVGVTFGVVANTLATQDNFDASPKSVVISTTISKVRGQGNPTVGPEAAPSGSVTLTQHKPTAGLKKILDQMGKSW